MNDLQDIASGVVLYPTHSIMFEALRDTADATTAVDALRTVDVRELGEGADSLVSDAWYLIRDWAAGTDSVTTTRAWHQDFRDTAQVTEVTYSGAIFNLNVSDTAAGADGLDQVTTIRPLTDLAQAVDVLSGAGALGVSVLDTAAGWDRLTVGWQTDTRDLAAATDTLHTWAASQYDVQDTATGTTSLDGVGSGQASLRDTALAFSRLSLQITWQADLRETGYAFSLLNSTGAMLQGSAVVGRVAISNNIPPLSLGVVYQTGMGWTCNTLTFAMSAYTGDLTTPGFTGILSTGRSDFGSHKTKRVGRLYSQHKSSAPLTLGVQADGRGVIYANGYSLPATECQVGTETQRVKLARGVDGDRWVFELSGVEPFTVESLTALVNEGVISHG